MACLRIVAHSVWDNFIYIFLLKQFGKVPARNTYLAERYAGPDISLESSKYVYEVMIDNIIYLLNSFIKLKVLNF